MTNLRNIPLNLIASFLRWQITREHRPHGEELTKLQNRKLRTIVKHSYEHVPYYHSLFKKNKLRPNDIATLEDLDKLPVPDPRKEERLAGTLEIIRGLSAYGAGNIPVLGLFEGPLTTACRIFEAEQIMRMIYKNPRVIEALLDRVTAFLIDFSQALIENGANVIFLPEPTASAAMISPAAFRKFVLPRLQAITRQLEVPCMLHICGDTSPVLDAIGLAGADVISLDQCMNLAECRSTVAGAVLGGNVDPINSLLNGSREQITEDTLTCLRTAGTSRFILMSGCGVPPGTPVEKVEAMVETAKAFGLRTGKY